MKKAVAYCRVSTAGQVGDDKFGIESQRDMINEYCAKNGIEVVAWYIDEAVSGAKDNRPEFDKIISGEVSGPTIEYVVVAKADRIARDISLYYAYKSRLKQVGIEILSVKEDWSAQDRLTAMILENFMAMVAEIERENIKVRMSGGRKQKAKHGGYSGGQAPYGYTAVGGSMVVNPEQAEVVRSIFEMREEGKVLREIVEELNAAGMPTRRGGEWTISSVMHILEHERTYRGLYRYGAESEWVQGQHEAILGV